VQPVPSRLRKCLSIEIQGSLDCFLDSPKGLHDRVVYEQFTERIKERLFVQIFVNLLNNFLRKNVEKSRGDGNENIANNEMQGGGGNIGVPR
jgi:hypothetical protein